MKNGFNFFSIVLVSISIFFSFSCKSQSHPKSNQETNYIPYYLDTYKSDSLYTIKNYPEAYKVLGQLFSQYKPIDYKKEIIQYIKLGHRYKNKNVKDLIKNHVVNFKYDPAFLEDNKELNQIFHSYYTSKELDQFYKDGQKKINWELRKQILEINESDQSVRNEATDLNKIQRIDSINAVKLKTIFENFGYPGEEMIGRNDIDKNEIIDLISTLMHISLKRKQEYFYDVILKYIKEGSCPPLNYAFMVDYENKSNPVYGTFINAEKMKSTSTKDIETMNKNRKAIGLYPLK